MAGSSDPEERYRVARYARTKELLAVVDTAFGAALMALALLTGSSARLRDLSSRVSARFAVSVFACAGIVVTSSISLPLSIYSGYVVERRYGLSNQSLGGWLTDWLKGLVLAATVGPPLTQAGYAVIARWPRRWWAILAGLLVPFSVIVANLAPVLIFPLFNRFRPIENRELEERIKRLAAHEGVSVSRVLQMDMSKQTKKANAFFTGVGNSRRIVLGDTLLAEFTDDEVEAVLSHELGHQVHRDMWKLIVLQLPVSLGGFYAVGRLAPRLVRRLGPRTGIREEEGVADPAALPALALIATAYTLAISPALNAIVRRGVEHPADVYALRLTHNPGAFISAMEKLGRINLADPNPPALVKWLFYTHPTLTERVEYARSVATSEGR